MTKPPKATPHSDLDGVHEDERPNTEVAAELGQGSDDLGLAADESARPQYSDPRKSSDDRTD